MHFTLIALLVVTVLALILFFIVWTVNNDQRKIKWRLKESYDNLVERNQMIVDITEEFRRRIIGLDRINSMVFLSKKAEFWAQKINILMKV